jgi:hypothetical protein
MKRFSGRTEQLKASIHRWDDANALFRGRRWRGAMYIAGYAMECLLKALLMKRFDVDNLDDLERVLKQRGKLRADATIYDHRIELYVQAADQMGRLRNDQSAFRDFVKANAWLPSWRYDPDLSNSGDARDFLNAVDSMLDWFRAHI